MTRLAVKDTEGNQRAQRDAQRRPSFASFFVASVLFLCVLVSEVAAAPQPPAFSTKIESVRVDVLVTEGGKVVQGLAATDFDVSDNGVPQQVDLVSFEQIPLNVILALDMSDSVAGERLAQLQDAGGAVLAGLTKDDQAALVTFSNFVSLAAPLSGRVADTRRALDDAYGFGATSLVDGVYAAMQVGESDAGRALLMVFSDGLDTSSWLAADAVLDAARRSDAVAYSAAIGEGAGSSFLRELSALTGGTLYKIESTRDLRTTFVRILEEFRHRYLISYSPRGVPQSGWHRLDVKVKNRRATIKARPGYLAGSTPLP